MEVENNMEIKMLPKKKKEMHVVELHNKAPMWEAL